jgi:murein DD-endopeptidase MepM/ murein hydrolase activator NlpD
MPFGTSGSRRRHAPIRISDAVGRTKLRLLGSMAAIGLLGALVGAPGAAANTGRTVTDKAMVLRNAGRTVTDTALAVGNPPPAVAHLLPAATGYLTPPSGYYRPVILGGKVFPVARSDFFGLLEFPNSWHAPRLRLVNGKWLLIGVHEGIDITAERGTPILSMTLGRVENVGWTFYGGTRVGVRGTDGRYYFYAHMSAVAPGIQLGRRVAAGTYLGRVGNTGYGDVPGHRDEFAPHLHFGIELANNGPWVNPYFTLVSLYSATVRVDQAAQARIDRLARSGNRAPWARAVSRLYMRLSPW